MGKYFISDELHRITFPDSEWVDVKEELSQADSDYILSSMVKPRAGESVVDMQLGKNSLMERAIKAWSFKSETGIVEITPDNISNLKTKYREQILLELNTLYLAAKEFPKN